MGVRVFRVRLERLCLLQLSRLYEHAIGQVHASDFQRLPKRRLKGRVVRNTCGVNTCGL